MYIILTSAQSQHGKCGHVHCADCAAIVLRGKRRSKGGTLG